MNMLKHLIKDRKGQTFDKLVARFLSHKKMVYDRDSFTKDYRILTGNKVFQSQRKIDSFFDSWTLQYGYPIVHAMRLGNFIRLTQDVCPVSMNTRLHQTFVIPINFVAENSAYADINKTEPRLWLNPPQTEHIFEFRGLSKWFIINNQRASYFRVMYDMGNYHLIRFELLRGDLNKISPVTRGQTVDDLLFLAKIGYHPVVTYKLALDMLEYLHRETNELVWEMADHELKELSILLRYTPAYEIFKYFMLMTSRRFYKHKVQKSKHPSKFALEWACFGGLDKCQKHTYGAFRQVIEQRESFEHLYEIICLGAKYSDRQIFKFIKVSMLSRLETQDMEIYLKALSCLENYSQLKESLNMIFRKTSAVEAIMTRSDKVRVVTGMCENSPEGCQAILDFTFQHPILVFKSLGLTQFKILLSYLMKSMYRKKQQRKLRLIVLYFNITDTDVIWLGMQSKRAWLSDNLSVVSRWLGEFIRYVKAEDYDLL